VHFLNEDLGLATGIHEIGAATVKNYAAAVRQWFGVDLTGYSFALMPLAFLGMPRQVEGVTLNLEERHLLKYLSNVRDGATGDQSDDFNVALTIEVRVHRSRDSAAIPIVHVPTEGALTVSVDEEDIREKYPWSYDILTARLQRRYPDFKANKKYHDLRKPLEKDARFCRERLLDPAKPDGIKKKFYSPNIAKEFDPSYQRSKPEPVSAAQPVADEARQAS
jgi:hypothetical protein